jgi:hypothetical protein
MEERKIKFAEGIDISRAEVSDRAYCRAILEGILQFERPMPKVEVDLYPTPDHYNLAIKGWNQSLSVTKLYDTFMSKNRSQLYDPILSVSVEPVNDEGVPVLLFRLRKSSFGKVKKRE